MGVALPAGHGRAIRWRGGRCWPTSWASTPVGGVLGGSMGGMRALEWLVGSPTGCEPRCSSRPAPARTADQIATQSAQICGDPADPAGAAATTTTTRRARTAAWASRAASRT